MNAHRYLYHNMQAFDGSWTLFLDRDGVLNVEKPEGYILHVGEFVLLPGVEEALQKLAQIFGRIIIVTNQRGVGRGLMRQADLDEIHRYLRSRIEQAGGRIDAIYACTDAEKDSPCRKPNTGMALQAKRDFPEIDFIRSVMVGNSDSDMLFGRQLGMRTVWIATTKPAPEPPELADEIYPSLWAWVFASVDGQRQLFTPEAPGDSV